ncbi:hypothetical protein BDP27DRAFT_1444079 [Rhodocollybia butyracea]|uniref:RNA polymerase II degradation factor 1 n=1 Tax=Rhodocollybia butyracea TaxID=206335 RepID=A0A9P5Q4X1_9AGAR|nr:hypothetical protein BDP27DRAFT_1444079 [Rhodocollybia butyracea]
MASYKSAIHQPSSTSNSPRPAAHPETKMKDFKDKARQLQEFFPSWSHDDLHSLLVEVNGDVEEAATRISDGKAEQWGSVSRKKDKKAVSTGPVSRGDSRGTRGGFGGGRGGGRGGAVHARGGGGAGRPRGAATGGRGGSTANGHTSRTASPAIGQHVEPIDATSSDTPPTWAEPPKAEEETTKPSVLTTESIPHKPTPSKVPATSKLSWAQIAKPQEKPTPQQSAPESAPAPPPEPEPMTNTGWEDPTTVQTPLFDEEPSVPAPAPEEPVREPEPEPIPAPVEPAEPEPVASVPAAPPTPTPSTPSKIPARPAPISNRTSARYSNYAKIASDQGGVVMPPTPSSIGANLSTSFGSFGLKSAGVEKVGMQFGSLGLEDESESDAPAKELEASTEPPLAAPSSSTSLGSGLYQSSSSQPIQTSTSQPVIPSSSATASPAQTLQQAAAPSQPLSQLPQQLQQQAAAAVQAQAQTLPSSSSSLYAQHGLPTHIDPASPPLQSQPQQQSQQQQQQQQGYLRQNDQSPYAAGVSSGFNHTSTPPQSQTQDNGYGSFGASLGGSQSLASQGLGGITQGLSMGQGQGALAGMGGLGGAALGGQGLSHQQQQASLSAFDNYGYEGGQRSFYDSYQPNTFGGRNVLSHEDLKGGLASQQQASTAQTPSTSSGTPTTSQSSAQSAQSPATSVSPSAQGQPQPGQGGPAPGYHPAAPVPTYYYQPFPHQNSYYSAAAMGAPSNYGYSVGGMGGMGAVGVGVPQPYPGMSGMNVNVGKYPTMYPGPPGSASPAGKPSHTPGMGVVGHGHGSVLGHGGIGVQPQNYGGGLYAQQQGYDDYSHHTAQHHQQQNHQQHHTSHGLGIGQDYKQLYGGGQGGLQGYTGSAGVGGSGAARGSPETSYKPYAGKDVGVGGVSGVARGNVQQQGQGQGQSGGQGQGQGGQGAPQGGQGFYGGAARFGGGVGGGNGGVGGGGAPQQYPQGQNDAGYYYQQQRQQQQYWQ